MWNKGNDVHRVGLYGEMNSFTDKLDAVYCTCYFLSISLERRRDRSVFRGVYCDNAWQAQDEMGVSLLQPYRI
jgi:hypothetical protein